MTLRPLPMEEDEDLTIEGETLESLLQASKTPHGRSRLASTETLPILLRRLLSSPPSLLLPLLRILRNLCAGDASNQNSFLQSDGPDAVATVLLKSPSFPPDVLRVGLQLLGNVALAGDPHRSAVWDRFFPEGFLVLARVRESGVCDPLCMVLDTCCSSEGGRRRLERLLEVEEGVSVLREIITTASTVGYQEEWLEWLLSKICIEESYFFQLFSELGLQGVSDNCNAVECRDTLFTLEQAFLLQTLSKCLGERPEDINVSNNFPLFVLNILKEAYAIVDFSSRGSSNLPTGSPATDVLGYSLLILRDICAWEDYSSLAKRDRVDTLLSSGLLELLLDFLRVLEPPLIVKKSITHGKDQGALPFVADNMKVCPYKGFRKDVVSVIGNCLHRRKQAQDDIRERNGILLLLQQCVVDEDNPYLREWGLLTVRNLLEGNEENQREVAELELQKPVDAPEIAGLGLRVEVDKDSGRPKLVNIS